MAHKGLVGEISAVTKSDYATGALYVALGAAVLGDLIPTPADGLYFWTERNLRDKWKNGSISPKKYWTYTALAYYGYNFGYWLAILGIVVATKGTAKHKLTVMGGIVGAGAVVGVLLNNVKKDTEQLEMEKEIKGRK